MNTPFNKQLSDVDLKALGINEYNYLKVDDIVFDEIFRKLCENNSCGNYNKTWACPPAIGTFEECKNKVLEYTDAFMFCGRYPLEDSFDVEGMEAGRKNFRDVCIRVFDYLNKETMLLGNESCYGCKKCTYPDAPCIHKDRLFPSIEGYCINVSKLCEKTGIKYIINPNTVSYFGIALFNKK